MGVSYNRLWKMLINKNMKRIEMQYLTGISAWKCGEQNEEETASYMKEQDLEYEKIYRILA